MECIKISWSVSVADVCKEGLNLSVAVGLREVLANALISDLVSSERYPACWADAWIWSIRTHLASLSLLIYHFRLLLPYF